MKGEPRQLSLPPFMLVGPQRPVSPLLPTCLFCSFFCPANTSSVVGKECPAGHYCPVSTSFASEFPCPRGTYKPQRGGVQQSDCTLCEPGKGTGTYPTTAILGHILSDLGGQNSGLAWMGMLWP